MAKERDMARSSLFGGLAWPEMPALGSTLCEHRLIGLGLARTLNELRAPYQPAHRPEGARR
jgi:hypothetical protein